MSLLLLALLAGPGAAADRSITPGSAASTGREEAALGGGHSEQVPEQASVDRRRAILEEMWQRRILPPDQGMWSPNDYELIEKIRLAEVDALDLLKRKFGGYRSWVAKPRAGGLPGAPRLTKEGYEKYLFVLSQDAIEFFESKGVDAKLVFKLKDMDGKALFNGRGSITEDGARVYRRAKLNLEIFWKAPDGEIYGTRRPPR